MTDLSLLAAAAAAPTRLNPIKLFLDADIVVQAVMLGLLLASVWTWMIIVSFSLRMTAVKKRCRDYEEDFWQTDSFDALMKERAVHWRKELGAEAV